LTASKFQKIGRRCSVLFSLILLKACVSYEPAVLVPTITLSDEQADLTVANASDDSRIDFGVTVGVNESDSLFNVQTLPGVVVRDLAEDGPAANAGIQPGDVILEINGVVSNQPDAIRALERQASVDGPFQFLVRRGTVVFEASVTPRQISSNAPPEELYRLDPVASRAGYRSRLVELDDEPGMVAAEVVRLLADSPLSEAGIVQGALVLALDADRLSSAQDLVTRLNRDYELGANVTLTVFDGNEVRPVSVQLWDPGRRISRVGAGPLFQYRSSLNPNGRSLSILDFWLFSVYDYRRVDGESSHSILGLLNFTSDYGELVEEQ